MQSKEADLQVFGRRVVMDKVTLRLKSDRGEVLQY